MVMETRAPLAKPAKKTPATDIKQRIRQILGSQTGETVAVLPSLLLLQDKLRYIPPEAIEETARFCSASINEVWSVVAFYTNFRFTPPGRYILDVCWGPACHIKGAQAVLNQALETLNLSGEGTDASDTVTLKYNTCLGACAHAPVVAFNHELIGAMTPEVMSAKLLELRGERDSDG